MLVLLKVNLLFFYDYDYVCDIQPDLIVVTETWFNENDSSAIIDCTSPGYCLLDCHRTDSRGVGDSSLVQGNNSSEKSFYGYI